MATPKRVDNLIQSIRIAEHPDVMLPVMTMTDGFITSHGMENVFLLEDEECKHSWRVQSRISLSTPTAGHIGPVDFTTLF